MLVFQLITYNVKTDRKYLSQHPEPLYTCRGLVEKSEENNTLLKNIPVTLLGAILAIDNNRFSVILKWNKIHLVKHNYFILLISIITNKIKINKIVVFDYLYIIQF
jgi:hypothetical protein